ncbi:hypothetical protein RYX36_020804 [Vicia faba]
MKTLKFLPEKRYGGEDATTIVVNDNYPKQFGVAIDKKRAREEGKCGEEDIMFSLNQPKDEKSESSDLQNG